MLMVVFGAGASYDSVLSRPPWESSRERLHYRPPLANELFGTTDEYRDSITRFPKCKPILPRLQGVVRQGGSVEVELERLQEEADAGDWERYKQLAAVRYYLHYLLIDFIRNWDGVTLGVTNYSALLDDIRHHRRDGEATCLGTFNYDTLLEAALAVFGLDIQGIGDYIRRTDLKVIKLHGSAHWGREVDSTFIQSVPERNVWELAHEMIDRAAELDISQRFKLTREWPIARIDGNLLFPAIAIPFERKLDFECPPEHLEALRVFIPEVTKLLVIGWRATDQPFLELLAENIRPDLRGMVVTSGETSAREVVERLHQAGIRGEFSTSSGGFTHFISARESDAFLQD